ncbi:MAG: hypothetical protein EOO65_05455, partial [Methanosarcinales archaeon]
MVQLDVRHVSAADPASEAVVHFVRDGDNSLDVSTHALACSACQVGERPSDYQRVVVPAAQLQAEVTGLVPGRRYYVQVSALSERGYSAAQLAVCDPATSTYCSPDADFMVGDVFGLRMPVVPPGAPTRAVMHV